VLEAKIEECGNQGNYLAVPADGARLAKESIQSVPFEIKATKKKSVDRGCWLALVDKNRERRLNAQNVGVPNAVVVVNHNQVDVPLWNVSEKRNRQFTNGSGALFLKPLKVTYSKTWVVPKEQAKQQSIKMILNDIGHVIYGELRAVDGSKIGVGNTLSTDSQVDSRLNTSEVPIQTEKEAVRRFETRPKTDHLTEVLTPDQRSRLSNLVEDYQDIFMTDKTDIGLTDLITHDIELLEGAKPFKEQVRRQNPEKRASAEEQIIMLRESQMIVPSHGPFASGIVLVRKSDGTLRLCVDFRKLNDMTKKDAFPLPRIDDTIERLGAA
jgi:hypothetical protein